MLPDPLDPDPSVEEPVHANKPLSEQQFLELYQALAGTLHAWVTMRVPRGIRRAVDPEDVTQEIAYRAYGGFDALPEKATSFRAWVFGIGRNVLREHLRRAARNRVHGAGDTSSMRSGILETVPAEITNISRKAGRREQIDLLLQKIEQLDEVEQKVVLYRGLEGMTFANVAEVIGTNEEAAKKRWQRLRARLQA